MAEGVFTLNHMKNMTQKLLMVLALAFALSGCHQTYPESKIVDDLRDICRKEYGIDRVEVKFNGNTIGVYLPLKKLFAANLKEALLANVQNIESLLEPSPEAMEQVEDVLFTTSRVVLSTDKKIDFYVLQATDTENTGLEMVLVGNISDIKRVRLWDISRNEYRKRVLHDLRLNRTVVWARPVKRLFDNIGKKPMEEILITNFSKGIDSESISPFFHRTLIEADNKTDIHFEFLDLRSQVSAEGEALVYAKVKETYNVKPGSNPREFLYPSGSTVEYIFSIEGKSPEQYLISRIIPFNYVDASGILQKIPFPEELHLDENLSEWRPEFDIEDIQLGDFLATQVTRRINSALSVDERVFNTISAHKIELKHHPAKENEAAYFSLEFSMRPKSATPGVPAPLVENWTSDEDFLYVFNIVVNEFVTVTRSYQFQDFDRVELVNILLPASSASLKTADLELFRRKKIDIIGLFHTSGPSAI